MVFTLPGHTSKAAARERIGWEMRCLREMEEGPVVYCYPGYMGSHHERLVAKGFATRESVGDAPMPDFWPDTPQGRRDWREREPQPQFRYTITDAGRAAMTRWRDAQG